VTEPPEGYLGADGPIRSGPAPELVEAGYELELADAPLLARGFGLADLAHAIALEAIPAEHRRALVGAVLELLDEEIELDSRYGDLANVRERELERRLAQRRTPAARGGPDRVPDRAALARARPRAGRQPLRGCAHRRGGA
jgi:argininosuccinate lyase